jgi:predicted nucleotidyltransferase
MEIATIKKKIVPVLKHRGVTKAAIFGSFARGEAKKNSDVDILVEFGENVGLFELIRLESELEKRLGRKVDVLTYGGLYHLLRDIILSEQKIIYEKRP